MSETNVQKFKRLLSELFMFDHADLDFGIYRIMNAKRDEIRRFLDDDLLPQVRKEIEHLDTGKREQLLREREETLQQLRNLLVPDPENNPKIREIDAQLAQSVDVTALENEIFSNLYDFFRRYYSEGDYLALRRYKEGVYSIPYEGEEVKLHWANADQYYIKTSEYFRDYTFKLPDHRRVHFKLTSADTEQNNNKSANGEKRVFILCTKDFIEEVNGELVICFEYRVDPQKRKQDDLNQEAVQNILNAPNLQSWMMILGRPAPTDTNPDRTFLHKYLADYTSRNTFDYFIHKDLGTFLRRELDFFIKNEIMHLDDIEHESAPRVEVYLSKIKALRRVAKKVIDFLEQLENFQKKLWLKKKFVIETNYCVTLDRIPEELYPQIASNDAQREEWVRLFAIDSIEGDLVTPKYSQPLSVEFLKFHQSLVIDTKYFTADFKYKVLSAIESLDTNIDGILIHGDNFQALNLIKERYQELVDCIFIDPPYNTGLDDFPYKDRYQHSSWIAMMQNRLKLATHLFSSNGSMWITLDDTEASNCRLLGTTMLSFISDIAWEKVYSPRMDAKQFSNSYDHVLVFATAPAWSPKKLIIDPNLEQFPHVDKEGKRYRSDPLRKWGKNSLRSDRPNLWFPIKSPEGIEVWPIKPDGTEGCWRWQPSTVEQRYEELDWLDKGNGLQPYVRQYAETSNQRPVETIWLYSEAGSTHEAQEVLKALLPQTRFPTPKPPKLVRKVIESASQEDSVVVDFFAGSGTTGQAVIEFNRDKGGDRKYILIEMGDTFDSVLKPRILKVIHSKEWRSGKPVDRHGFSHIVKYMQIESYEDTLNNLKLQSTLQQQKLMWEDGKDRFREDYMLHYMLDVEAKGSASLLDLKQFANPFNYQLEISTGTVEETRPTSIDLVETFNYLLGLNVRRIQAFDHICIVEGENRESQQILIIWRNQEEVDNAKLDAFFQENGGHEANFDLIYINGDNNLENLKQGNEIWQALLIEEAFHRLMFDTHDV